MRAKISVVLPTYNVEKYLRKSVESIINQTLKDLEIIIVNDGSTDLSGDIANQLAKEDDRIILINQLNQGLSAARNAGLKIATGEYIVFIDTDDWIEDNALEKMYEYAKKNDCDVVQCNFRMVGIDNIKNVYNQIPYYKVFSEDEIKIYLKEQLIEGKLSTYAWDKIYKLSFLKKNNLYFESIKRFEDWYFVIKLISKVSRFMAVDEIFYNYRVIDGSLSKRYYDDYENLVINLHKEKYKYMKIWNMVSEKDNKKFTISLGNDILNLLSYIFNPQYCLNKSEKLNKIRFLSNDKFLIEKFYNENYKIYLKEININKIYLYCILYCLKYKNYRFIYFFKKYI